MKAIKTLVAAAAFAMSASAFATPVNVAGSNGEATLQDVINSLYGAPGSPVSAAPNVNTNQAAESGQFRIEASGGAVANLLIEIAGMANSNTFGIYDVNNPGQQLQLFNGAATTGYRSTLLVTFNAVTNIYSFLATTYGLDANNDGFPDLIS